MSGRGFDEALENARLVIARIPTPGFVIALVVFGWFHSQAAGQGETIYDNTNSQNQFLPTRFHHSILNRRKKSSVGELLGAVTSFRFNSGISLLYQAHSR